MGYFGLTVVIFESAQKKTHNNNHNSNNKENQAPNKNDVPENLMQLY